jgi:hypothetical protein
MVFISYYGSDINAHSLALQFTVDSGRQAAARRGAARLGRLVSSIDLGSTRPV